MNIKEIREKYPQYGDMSDGDLAQALHKKYYSDIPYEKFEQQVFNTKPYQTGNIAQSIGEVSNDFSGASKFAIGAAGAINGAAMRLKQLTGRDLTPEDIKGLDEYKALEKASGEAVAGNIGMQVLSTLQPGAALYKGATAVAGKVLPKILAPAAGAAASGGLITAATQPTLEGESTAGNAGLGAAGAAVADVATRGLARVAQPIAQSEPVKKLLGQGVVPTPGAAAGGLVSRIEQSLESVPVIGWMISGGRNRAVKELDAAALKKALPAGTAEQVKAGRDGIERAGDLLDAAYDSAYNQIKGPVKVDSGFFKAIGDIPKQEGIDLPPSLAKRFDALMKDRVFAKMSGEGASPDAIRDAQNSLGALARKYRGSLDPDQQALGQAFSEAKGKLRELVSRQSSGDFKATLDSLDKKYSALLTVEKASGYQGTKDGIFSAEALRRASKKSTGEMKDLASAGDDVMGRTVPDSGTAGRTLLPLATYAASGGAAGANDYLGGPSWLTGALAAPLLYSRMGSRYMLGDYAGQQATSDAIRRLAPYFALTGRAVAEQ